MNVVVRSIAPLTRLFQFRQLRASRPDRPSADLLFLQWLCFVGFLLFASFMLWRANIWGILVAADPTGITLMIVGVFVLATIWVGLRSCALANEQHTLNAWMDAVRPQFGPASAPVGHSGCVEAYFSALLEKSRHHDHDNAQLTEVLAERLHGPSESAWWVNGIQIKLGLLGKVIGFSILAIQISQIQNFDPSQSQNLLKTLTGGLGVALLTTAVGLVANMLLGIQLVKMDRCGDNILADALEFAETGLAKLTRQDLA
ncbi:MAG: hypothetical protein WBJ21_02305 [Burkholderiaceae bacterium]|jgi:hypothetical protein